MSISQKRHGRPTTVFSVPVDVIVARGGVAIRYVNPVLWMTSCFRTIGLNYCIDSTKFRATIKVSKYIGLHIVNCAPATPSLLSTVYLFGLRIGYLKIRTPNNS